MKYPMPDEHYDCEVFCDNFREIEQRLKLLEGQTSPEGLPEVTVDDNGKMLQVVDGVWNVVTIANGNEQSY